MHSFTSFEPVCCSMPVLTYFLTCILISQEAGQVVWYSHLLNNFPQFFVIHTVKGFNLGNKVDTDVFLEFSCFFYDLADVGNLISGSSAFSKSILDIWKFMVHVLLKPGLENFEHYFTSVWDECNCAFQFSSVSQSCLTLCNLMNGSTPGFPVHHQLPEFTQTHVHRVSDAIQPSQPLSSPSPPAPNPSQHQSFPMSQLFTWGGQSIGVSASATVLPKNTQDRSPLEWTEWISLQSKGLSRVFFNTTVQKHQFFGAQPSSQSNSHIHTWPQEKP